MKTFKGRTALVTGASSGIGEAIARRLAQEGMDLVLVARSEARLRKLAEELAQAHGVRATLLASDKSLPGCGAMLIDAVDAAGLKVDLLVNNAGFGLYGPFETLASAASPAQVALNLRAVVDLSHAFLPGMLERLEGTILRSRRRPPSSPGPTSPSTRPPRRSCSASAKPCGPRCAGGECAWSRCARARWRRASSRAFGDDSIRKTPVFSAAMHPGTVATAAMKALCGDGPTHIVGLRNWLLVQSTRLAPRGLVARIGAAMLMSPRVRRQAAARG